MLDLYRRRRIDAHIDLTPIVDTLLQIFLIFLLSASFALSAVRMELPRAAQRHDAVSDQVAVRIDRDGTLSLEGKAIPGAELRDRLRLLLEADGGGKRAVQLLAHRGLSYETVLDAMIEIRAAGATQILLVYDPQELPER